MPKKSPKTKSVDEVVEAAKADAEVHLTGLDDDVSFCEELALEDDEDMNEDEEEDDEA